MNELLLHFPKLTEQQQAQFAQLFPLYQDWNAKINVISRKDIDNLYAHHVLHSLAISKIIRFRPNAQVLDLGTGGGFPGIPLAIMFPETKFTLIDGTKKKLQVVQEVATAIGLENVTILQQRAEEMKAKKSFDFVVSRAVASIDKLFAWSARLISDTHEHAIPNGLIALKGGKVKAELKTLHRGTYFETTSLHKIFKTEYYEEKFIVYVQK